MTESEKTKLKEAVALVRWEFLPWTVGTPMKGKKNQGCYKMPQHPPMTFASYDLALEYIIKFVENQKIS